MLLECYPSLSVSKIQSLLPEKLEQSQLSHHLIKMKRDGILIATRTGRNIYYELADRRLLGILDCVEKCPL